MRDILSSRITSIEELFHLGCLGPAAVQRDFQWRERQSEQMLKDILDALKASADVAAGGGSGGDVLEGDGESIAGYFVDPADDDRDEIAGGGLPEDAALEGVSRDGAEATMAAPVFFLGSIILCPGRDAHYEIFDGLQRITTLTILLAILRDRIRQPQLKARLASLIATNEGSFRLSHRGENQILPSMVQAPGEAMRVRRRRPDWAAGQRIFDVARQLRNSLPHEESRLVQIAEFLLERVRFSLVMIADRRLARHTFVATNLYGVPLNRGDVFKGELLELARHTEEGDEITERWGRIWDKVSALEGGRERGTTPAAISKFEQFLACCDMVERRRPQSVDFLGDLITHLGKRAQAGELLSWLASVDMLADAWVDLETRMRNPGDANKVDRAIWTMNFFKWHEWRPLALYWMAQARAGARLKTSQWRFDMLTKRCLAITLLELDQARRAEMFRQAVVSVIGGRRPFDETLKKRPLNLSNSYRTRVRDALRLPVEHHEVRRTLMLWYEASLWGERPPRYIRSGSVEHILPGRCGAGSQWLDDFPDPKRRYIHHASIGNLALVDIALQRPLANCDFAIPGGKKSTLQKAGQFGKYKTLDGVQQIDQWLPTVIGNRTAAAADHIWSRLGLPDPR